MAVLPDPAAELPDRFGARVVAAVLLDIAGEAATLAFPFAVAGQRLEGCEPAVGLAAQADRDAQPVGAVEDFVADAVGEQRAARKGAGGVDETAGPRVVADGDAEAAGIRILDQAAGHLDGVLHLVLVVEIDRRIRQHDRLAGACGTSIAMRVEQRQLPGRMVQAGDDLFLGLAQAGLVVVVAALLFLLQHGDGHGDHGQGERQEGAAKEQAQAEGGEPSERRFH